jgi:hypothetical protein
MLAGLWAVVVGPAAAMTAWRPTWIDAEDLKAFVMPPEATRAMGESDEATRVKWCLEWAQQPYISDLPASDAAVVAQEMLSVVFGLATIALSHDGYLVALASTYVQA